MTSWHDHPTANRDEETARHPAPQSAHGSRPDAQSHAAAES